MYVCMYVCMSMYMNVVKFRKIFAVGNQMSLYHVKNLENCRLWRWFSTSYAKLAFILYSSSLAARPSPSSFLSFAGGGEGPETKPIVSTYIGFIPVRMYTVLPSIETGDLCQLISNCKNITHFQCMNIPAVYRPQRHQAHSKRRYTQSPNGH